MSKKLDGQKSQRIQVFARCRPLNSLEKKQCSSSIVQVFLEKKEITLKDRNTNRDFFFDKVFPPDAKQVSVYKAVVEPLIKEVLMGYNCTVFAYGQTGTGKTYTMEGERSDMQCSWEDDPGAGIIPRSLHHLFEELSKEDNVEFSVRVSFLELYNEELFDLLSANELSRLRLYEDNNRKGSVIIQGLEEIVVNNKAEVYTILEKGTARRQSAATMLNSTSSRSHTVFSVTVHIKENTIEGEELLKTGKLNLVDVAGSENVGRSGAIDKRAREAGSINQSLLTLGRVITALSEKQPHVPYRESKLTRLLQDSLGGHTKTSIIATISPALSNFDETISTLDYATKAKSITINPVINQRMTKRALIREYTEEIERQRKDLIALRDKEGFFIDSDNYTSMLDKISVGTAKIKELNDKIEAITEENMKIDQLFNDTKQELSHTCIQLHETTLKYEETASELNDTCTALSYTQKVLSNTALERDEDRYLLNIQAKTEKELSHQAKMLLQVADQTTNDIHELHAKLDRKQRVEQTNEERCQDFKRTYQKQFAKLDDMVTGSKDHQIQNLQTIKSDIDCLVSGLCEYKQETEVCLQAILSLEKFHLQNLSSHISGASSDQRQWGKSMLQARESEHSKCISEQHTFLDETLPSLLKQLSERNTEMENWILNMHRELCEKVDQHTHTLEAQSAQKTKLLHTMCTSLDSFHKHHEAALDDLKEQIEELSNSHTHMEDELRGIVASVTNFSNQQKAVKENMLKLDHTHSQFESSVTELKNIGEPLNTLKTAEDDFAGDLSVLDDIASTIQVEELSKKRGSVLQSQSSVTSEITGFLEYTKKTEEENCNALKTAFGDSHIALSNEMESNETKINETITSLTVLLDKSENGLQEHNETLQGVVAHSESVADDSEKSLNKVTLQLKDEILKRDIEFEKFISEDLIKDIPTGATPQRKTYEYPTTLAATSPHEAILQRYRSQLSTGNAAASSLSLDCSFRESEASKIPIAKGNSNDRNSRNVSYMTDDYDSTGCESDSNASSVSDISVGSFKENSKDFKKNSRMPQSKKKFKGFLRPEALSARKPLHSTNSDLSSM